LLGASDFEAALIEQWIDFAVSEIELPAKIWLYPILGFMEYNKEATNKAKGDIRKVLEILNEHLHDQTYLVGERITLADIVVAIHLLHLFKEVLDTGFRKPFENVVRWFTTLIHQPQFESVVGEVHLAIKMAHAEESHSAAPAPAAPSTSAGTTPDTTTPQKAQKEKKPKQESKPAEPKPESAKPKKKKEEEEEEEEDEEHAEAKTKNPLDDLPPSPFKLDDWKRFYSNNDTAQSTAWFWEHFDKEGWSLWHSNFKYNEENESLLKTCNYLGGWLQRLDKLRKYGFGNAIILKSLDDKVHELSAVWLIRGQELPKEVTDCDDTEHFNWTKLNPDDEQTKKIVNEYWSWEGSFGGHTFVQGRTYK